MSRWTRRSGAALARSGRVSAASLGTKACVTGPTMALQSRVRRESAFATTATPPRKRRWRGTSPQRLDGRGVSSGDNGEVGVLGGVGLDGPVEVEQRVAREAEAGGEQVGEVGEVGGETHAIERGRVGDLARFEPGAGGGAKPDLRRGTGEGAHALNALSGEARLQLRNPDIAADTKVVVAEGHLDRDIALAEDAEAKAAFRFASERRRREPAS